MSRANIKTAQIQWHEGMLLLPQHFQQLDLRIDQLFYDQLTQLHSHYWGVSRLEIDQALLTTGTFRVLDISAVMPDGLVIQGLNDDAPALEAPLKKLSTKMQKEPMTVYLCVPELNGDDTDVIGSIPRFSSFETKGIVDINTGEEEIEVPRLHANMSLSVGYEPPARHTSIPLAKITYDSKSFSLMPYIPPCLKTSLTSSLGQLCNDLAQRLRTKLSYLQQKVQGAPTGSGAKDLTARIENVRLKLIAGLLPFEATFSSGCSHPYDIYKSLCGLAGQISGIRFGEIPPHFDSYNHNEILASVQQIIQYTDQVMDEVQESYSVVPFQLEDRTFKLVLRPEWLGSKFVLGARVPVGVSQDLIADWIKNCVIVSEKYVTTARDNRVLGAARDLVDEVPEMNLVPVRGMLLFSVVNDPEFISPGEPLCLFNDSDTGATRPQEIMLYNAKTTN